MKASLFLVFVITSVPAFSQNIYPSTGNVGIGTSSPADQLEVVNGNRKVGLNTVISGVTNGGVLSLSRSEDGMRTMFFGSSPGPNFDPIIYGKGGSSYVKEKMKSL